MSKQKLAILWYLENSLSMDPDLPRIRSQIVDARSLQRRLVKSEQEFTYGFTNYDPWATFNFRKYVIPDLSRTERLHGANVFREVPLLETYEIAHRVDFTNFYALYELFRAHKAQIFESSGYQDIYVTEMECIFGDPYQPGTCQRHYISDMRLITDPATNYPGLEMRILMNQEARPSLIVPGFSFFDPDIPLPIDSVLVDDRTAATIQMNQALSDPTYNLEVNHYQRFIPTVHSSTVRGTIRIASDQYLFYVGENPSELATSAKRLGIRI